MNYKRVIKISAVYIACGIGGMAALIGIEVDMALHGPPLAAFTNPDHAPQYFGDQGKRLTYIVIGDSTGAGQGAAYPDGIAIRSAQHLALSRRVTMYNFSVSGAVTKDVLSNQLPEVAKLRPDIVLVLIGSNDVTHLTHPRDLQASLGSLLIELARNPAMPKIIVSGAGDLGACPRFAQPLRWIVGLQTAKVNRLMQSVTTQYGAIWADIAAKTGPSFREDPTIFSKDGFHPNARGYVVWTRFIDLAIDRALRT